jgi:hypothetical protein
MLEKTAMKKLIILFTLVFGSLSIYAQTPTPDPDTMKNPVKDIDPEVKQLPPDLHYAKEEMRINAEELPAAVLDTLKRLEPKGWEKSVVYHDRKENTFIVEIRESGNEKTYRFNKEGRQIKPAEQKKE